jgi:hypothetical protein
LKIIHRVTALLFTTILLLPLNSCISINYSFTGAPITAKTISIDYFPNKASLVNSSLSQDFTDALRDKFVNQTKLELIEQNAELELSGTIIKYYTTAMAIQGNETAALNRLSIVIRVKFNNTLDEEASFEQDFTGFEDYDASKSFASVEDALVTVIIDRLVQDIFNKALVNW